MIVANALITIYAKPQFKDNLHGKTNNYFLGFYILEALLKMSAFGFLKFESGYFNNSWNIFSLIIIILGITEVILGKYLYTHFIFIYR